MYRKEIVYDRITRDYAMYLDGELVGFARTYHEAEITLDQLVFELMSGLAYVQQPTPNNDPRRATAGPSDPLPDDFPGTDDEDGIPQPLHA